MPTILVPRDAEGSKPFAKIASGAVLRPSKPTSSTYTFACAELVFDCNQN